MTEDVLVIGGGAVGACAALELARSGAKVTLLERGPEVAWGCSAGNAGLIHHALPLATPAALKQGLRWMLKPDSPFYLRPHPAVLPWLARFAAAATPARTRAARDVLHGLSVRSFELHAALAAEGLETGYERRGTLLVYLTEAGFAAARDELKFNAAAGLRFDVLEPSKARELEPALAHGFYRAVYYPDEAHCEPAGFVRAVARAATDAGAELRTGVEAIGFRLRNGRVDAVETTHGELLAGDVVLAAGAWTSELARRLDVFLPLEGGKGYHLDVEPGESDPSIPVFVQETRVIATPLAGRLRLAGTLELSGLDLSVSHARVEAIRQAAEHVLRGLRGRPVVEVWRGLRPCTPDGLPAIGRPSGLDNVVLATGHAMLGLTLAPVTGLLVAELVAGRTPSLDVAPLSPDRFHPLLGL